MHPRECALLYLNRQDCFTPLYSLWQSQRFPLVVCLSPWRKDRRLCSHLKLYLTTLYLSGALLKVSANGVKALTGLARPVAAFSQVGWPQAPPFKAPPRLRPGFRLLSVFACERADSCHFHTGTLIPFVFLVSSFSLPLPSDESWAWASPRTLWFGR